MYMQIEIVDIFVITRNFHCCVSLISHCITETLRLYPPAPRLLRICTNDYRIPDSDYVIKKGESLIIPTGALMKDPQYFPNPDEFDPEHFSEEAKASRPTCCFLPFGTGPRNCIGKSCDPSMKNCRNIFSCIDYFSGMRFAIMEIKVALASIMKDYTVSLSSKMELPIKFTPYIVLSVVDSKILLQFLSLIHISEPTRPY